MPSRIQINSDTAANWTSVNPVLAQGEIGFEYDTRKSKIGDGTSAWNSLGYVIEQPFSTTEKAKLADIQAGAQVNTVASVHGRTGAITAQSGDYTADQISDGAAKVIMTALERSKLAGIEKNAQVNPPAASNADVTAGTSSTIAGFTPAQLKLAAQTFGGASLVSPTSPLGNASTQSWIGSYQDAQTGLRNVIAYIHGSYFHAYHIDETVVAAATDVLLPAAVDAGLTDVKKKALLFHNASRPGLAGPVAGQKFTAAEHNSLKIDLPTNTTVRLDPSTGRSGVTSHARAVCSVVSNLTTANDPYYCWSLGSFEVNVTSRRSFAKQTLVAASVNGWSGTLTNAQWKKCIVIPGWNSGAVPSRRLGPPIAWLPDPANVVVHMPISTGQAGSTFRFQIVCFEGSAWKVHHAYGLTGASAADEADITLRDTPPLDNFQVSSVAAVSIAAGGTGYTTGNVLTPSGTFTGTKPTFTVTASAGAVTAISAVSPGDFTLSPDSPLAMSGRNSDCTLTVGYSPVFAPQGSTSAVTTDWTHAAILSGSWRGSHFSASPKLSTDAYPIWLPGFGGGGEGSALNAVRYRFSSAHSNAYEAGYAYVLEDVYSVGTASRRMLVTRFDTTSTAANPIDIDITAAALPSTADAIVIGRSTTTAANPAVNGYDQGCVGWLLVSPNALRIVRENAEVGTFAGRAEVIRLPRREIV